MVRSYYLCYNSNITLAVSGTEWIESGSVSRRDLDCIQFDSSVSVQFGDKISQWFNLVDSGQNSTILSKYNSKYKYDTHTSPGRKTHHPERRQCAVQREERNSPFLLLSSGQVLELMTKMAPHEFQWLFIWRTFLLYFLAFTLFYSLFFPAVPVS